MNEEDEVKEKKDFPKKKPLKVPTQESKTTKNFLFALILGPKYKRGKKKVDLNKYFF